MKESECPRGWECNELCAYYFKFDGSCTYTEEERVNLKEIAEETEKRDYKETMEQTETLKKANEVRVKTESEAFWSWWGQTTHRYTINEKEVLPLYNVPMPGGGSNSKRRKQPTKKMPEYLKSWGL